ncbi:MAG: PIN domain-containing protein [Betaproteobacteria bacterium]|nr:PIN domain-containing protein [Betaproteobacteria bacterium]
MKVFLDANVVFSAAHQREGRAQSLLLLARAGRCDLMVSAHALEEARRNLTRKSHSFDKRLADLLPMTEVVAEAPAPLVAWALEHGLPLKDAPILAAAVHANADILATGDLRDFGHLFGKSLRGIRILSLAKAIEAVLG